MNYDLDTLWKSMVRVLDPAGKTVGSGFFIREDGYIITCHHVIFNLDVLQVEYSGKNYSVSWCEELSKISSDIAILKIDLNNLSKVQLSTPKDQMVSAMVYGFPAKKNEQFSQGFDIYGVLEQSPPVNTLSTYKKKYEEISGLQPWNKPPGDQDTFLAYKLSVGTTSGITSGISGGLVLDTESGNAIGVIQASTSQESYAIKWTNITEELKRLSISPDSVSAFSTIALRHQTTSVSDEAKVSYLPSKAYRELRGRQADVDNIMSALLDEKGRRIIGIDGIGGIGKTALAQEIAEKAVNHGFSDIVWLTASEKERSVKMTFDAVLDGIAIQLNAASLIKLTGEAKLCKTRELLLQRKVLIILDNMETAAEPQQEIAEQLFSVIGSSKAVLTSRYRFKSSSNDIYAVHLGGIDKETSLILVKDTALEKNMAQVLEVTDKELEPIIDAVGNKEAGYSPLALKFMVGQLMEYEPDTIIEYMQEAQIRGKQDDLSYNREFQKFWAYVFVKSLNLLNPQDIKFMYLMSTVLEPNVGTAREKGLRDAMRLNQNEFAVLRDNNWRISFLEIGHQKLQKRLYLHRLTFSFFSSIQKKSR